MSKRFSLSAVALNAHLVRRERAASFVRRLAFGAAIIGGVAFAASAQAQDAQPQDSPPERQMDARQMIDQKLATMTETLKLDSAQQTRVRWVLANETMDLEALRKKGGGESAGGGSQRGGRGGRGGGRRGATSDSTGSEDHGSSGGGSPEVRAVRDGADKQIEAILNAQQLTTYRQLFEQQREPRQSRSNGS